MSLDDFRDEEQGCEEISPHDIKDYAELTFEVEKGNSIESLIRYLSRKGYGKTLKETDLFFKAHISSCPLCNTIYNNFLEDERSLSNLSTLVNIHTDSEICQAKNRYDVLSRRFAIEHPEIDTSNKLRVYIKLKALVVGSSAKDAPRYANLRKRLKTNQEYEKHIRKCEYCKTFLKSAINFLSQVV